jgi:ComEC/Rec2-related protein
MPLILICAAALVGLAVGDLAPRDPPTLVGVACLALLGAVLARSHSMWRVIALIACAAAVGGLRASTAQTLAARGGPDALGPYFQTSVRVRATISQPPVLSASGTTLLLQVDAQGIAPAGRDPPPGSLPAPARLRVVAAAARTVPVQPAGEGSPRNEVAAAAQPSRPGEASGSAGVAAAGQRPPQGGELAVATAALEASAGDDASPANVAAWPSDGTTAADVDDRVNLAASPADAAQTAVADSAPESRARVAAGGATVASGGTPLTATSDADTATDGERTEVSVAERPEQPKPPQPSEPKSPEPTEPLQPTELTKPTEPAIPVPPGPLGQLDAPDPLDLGLGDVVLLEGRLLPAAQRGDPPTLLFPRLLAHASAVRGETAAGQGEMLLALLATVRQHASAGLHRFLPEPQASLAAGVLLGGAGQLDPEFRMLLQRSGLGHLLAIDGFKMVVVAASLGRLATYLLGPYLATIPTWLIIGSYTVLTGAHASAVRAALMVGLAGAAAVYGRASDSLTSLLLAVVAMASFEPAILLDVGLQLSLSATLGLILLWPHLRRTLHRARIGRHRLPPIILEPAGLTLAVTLATLPVMLSVFQMVSLASPLAHIAAVPLLAPLMLSTALLALVSPWPPLAVPIGWLAWLPSTLLVDITTISGSLPGAALATGRLSLWPAVGLAGGLLAWGIWGLARVARYTAKVGDLARQTPRRPGTTGGPGVRRGCAFNGGGGEA